MRPRDAAAPERARLVQRDEKTRLVQNGARSKRLTRASLAPAAVVGLYIISSAGNALMFKRMTDVYEGSEFFASQWNVLLYVVMSSSVVASKAWREPGFLKKQRACFSNTEILIMGVLDAVSSVLSCVGGSGTAGGVQNVINQTLIPVTLLMSRFWLGARYSPRQCVGAATILAGALWAVRSAGASGDASTTFTGATIFSLGILPSAYSNVYKEKVFSASADARSSDVYYLTTAVSGLQVLLGVLMVPLLPLPAFGGTPWRQIWPQFRHGFRCYLPSDGTPAAARSYLLGDDDGGYAAKVFGPPSHAPHDNCDEGFLIMNAYCLVNFAYNVLQLVITKHSSAATLVMSTALALPATSLMFSSKRLVGRDAQTFGPAELGSLVVVVVGFILYASVNPDGDGPMPIQAAAGSSIYVRRPRADSDPPTPALLRLASARPSPAMPRRSRATSFETRHHVSSPGDLIRAEMKGPG